MIAMIGDEDDELIINGNDTYLGDDLNIYDVTVWVIGGLVLGLFVAALILLLNTVRAVLKFEFGTGETELLYEFLKAMCFCLLCNLLYFAFWVYIVLSGQDWNIGAFFTGELLVTTETHWPFLVQIGLLICALILSRVCEKEILEQVSSSNLDTAEICEDYKPTVFENKELCACHQCNYPVTLEQQICPHCGAKVNSKRQETTVVLGMKWYKFLTKFVLNVSVVLNFIIASMYTVGSPYGEYTSSVYRAFPSLLNVDAFYGFVQLLFMLPVSDVKYMLKRREKKGPLCLMVLNIIITTVEIHFAVIKFCIIGINIFTVLRINCGIAMIILNRIYFSKRKEFFS
ncbi:MAG: hypothetical protein IJW49_10205 [Clostridia bacterium]|nr:hypothetical protein [Clostridia bacterium]